MASVAPDRPELMPWKDPLQAQVPALREGQLAAVYYGQRRSGDFYDFVRASPARVLLGLFDIAGDLKRTRSIVLALQQEFRSGGAELLNAEGGNEADSMLEMWIRLNRTVMQSAGGVHSCPAFVACFNEDARTLCYVNAGHTPGLVRHGRQVRHLEATALPLGLFSHSVPDCSMIAMGAGDALLVVSKGIVEARHRGEEYGLERARQYLRDTGAETAHETCIGILAQVREFMGTAPTHNDVTALSLLRPAGC